MIDGEPGTVLMDPLWQVQRAFVLAWLEVALEASGSPGSGEDTLPEELVVQLWSRRKATDTFDYVAEVILRAGKSRAIAAQQRTGYGFELPVALAAGSQNVVVHNGGAFWPSFAPPTITVTPHGTWA
jgi:hypothetical protein